MARSIRPPSLRGAPIVVANSDAPFDDHAGTMEHVIKVPYDNHGPALTVFRGGAIDVMPPCRGDDQWNRAGNMKPLAVFDKAANEKHSDVPQVTQSNETFGTYLPLGPLVGVFIPNASPGSVVAKRLQDTTWLLRDAGLIKASSGGFGIARLGN